MHRIYCIIIKLWHLIKIALTELFCKNYVVKMSVSFDCHYKLNKSNWGDDINYWFYKEIIDGHLISHDWSILTKLFQCPYILGIGSIITIFDINHSIIWGSGIISSTAPIKGKPYKVFAVRGPLTRKRLLESGIECPEIYGDPALLLPEYYKPKVQKKYKLGLIPHYIDQNNDYLKFLYNQTDILVIDVSNYDNWLDFIDKICQCEGIISSSLHGLIVSEAYQIPNIWMKVQDSELSDDFKFHDFFLACGHDRTPLLVNQSICVNDIYDALSRWIPHRVDTSLLKNTCPFRLIPDKQIKRII